MKINKYQIETLKIVRSDIMKARDDCNNEMKKLGKSLNLLKKKAELCAKKLSALNCAIEGEKWK